MASLKVRGRMLYVCWYDRQSGQPRSKSTGFTVDQREEAEAVLRGVERALTAANEPSEPSGGMTFEQWATAWLKKKLEHGKSGAIEEESKLRNHAYPLIGAVPLRDLDKKAMLKFLDDLQLRRKKSNRRTKARAATDPRTGERLGSRTVVNVATLVKAAMAAAVKRDIITVNPCCWTKADLPVVEDVDPERRVMGYCSGEEVYQLIFDRRVPEERRVEHAIGFLTGQRPGEQAERRFSDILKDLKPLPGIKAMTAWRSRARTVGPTKTRRAKLVPIHPALSAILDEWWSSGFERWQGRPPTTDDLIIPTKTGIHRNSSRSNRDFQVDLANLGLRKRVHSDTRATFKSLAMAARPDLEFFIDLCTHQKRSTINALYDRFQVYWPKMCEAVAAIEIKPPSDRNVQGDLEVDRPNR